MNSTVKEAHFGDIVKEEEALTVNCIIEPNTDVGSNLAWTMGRSPGGAVESLKCDSSSHRTDAAAHVYLDQLARDRLKDVDDSIIRNSS
jgi:hypothetical protein